KFPVVKTLDTFHFQAQPSINQELVRELIRGEYMDRCENVLLIGNSGTGKSHLATGLAFAACQQGRRVRFFTATGLVTQLLEKREERQLERFQKQLERLHLIVLDELGYVPFSKTGAELLFEVVSAAGLLIQSRPRGQILHAASSAARNRQSKGHRNLTE
ncbi:MAG: ATP-binding protein, partial [Planctomycetes bacterium]|nr:ATP-binding protein [Planctomycetota bacterium]